jgi:heme exporter protein A
VAALLRCDGLEIRRGRRRILTGVTLALEAGALAHLSGANGSGKTSLLRVLGGLSRPRAGRVARAAPWAFVPEKVALAAGLTPLDWLEAMRRLRRGAPRAWAAEVADSGLDAGVLPRPSATLSKGMLQRIALLEALGAGVPTLLLDEPFAGLDTGGRAWLAERLRAHVRERGGVAVVTDHSGAAAAGLPVTAALALADGRLLAAPRPPQQIARVLIRAHRGDATLERDVPDDEVDALLRALLDEGWHIGEVRPA